MKNAKEIREITNKVLEEKNAQKIEMMNNYIDKVIAPQIEEKAMQGKEMLTINVDLTKVDSIHELAKKLVANGYEIGFGAKYPMLKIYW